MSQGNQNFGFDADDPVIIGKTNVIGIFVAGLTATQVTSANWQMFDLIPGEGTVTQIAAKTSGGGGITFADGSGGVDFTITLDPADTSPLAGGDYFHRLDYVHSDGSQYESARGMGRLTPRA